MYAILINSKNNSITKLKGSVELICSGINDCLGEEFDLLVKEDRLEIRDSDSIMNIYVSNPTELAVALGKYLVDLYTKN
ncbi:MAG: hypothetical protein ACRCW9_05860 [Cetobacterium sp.]